MSGNKSRNSPSSPPSTHHASKLPKIFQKQNRDRSKSFVDPSASASSIASSSSSGSHQVQPPASTNFNTVKKALSKTPSKRATSTKPLETAPPVRERTEDEPTGEPPVIVEPPAIPRQRTRSERPVSDIHPFYQTSSNPRLTDFPTRLSGWFSHTFSSSSTDLSLPSLLSQSQIVSNAASTGSPKGKGPSALLTVAKQGKGHLDKAMRYLLDSDAMPDKCPDPIWLLGISHTGYEQPSTPVATFRTSTPSKRGSPDLPSSSPPSSFRPFQDPSSLSSSQSSLSSSASGKNPAANWPPVFYDDFTSRIWLTYRSQFSPIRDITLSSLTTDVVNGAIVPSSPQSKKWFGLADKGWTSDAGWGCMLRTGQSLLANTLLHLHLGREWRRPPYPLHTADFATYVQLLTWFLDSPSPLCPFSVHRMALAGKDLGKDVGQWFGPSTAAGAIKTLVHAFPEAGLGVSLAADSVVYQTDVFSASNGSLDSPRRNANLSWGSKGVLVLIGIRLGIDCVNPIYYDTIKELYTFPQSVGISGGRPSSSYYFVGSQADNLFYLDPHHARPAVPLRPPPTHDDQELNGGTDSPTSSQDSSRRRSGIHRRSSTSPRSFNRRTTFPLHTSSASSSSSHSRWPTDMDERELGLPGVDVESEELEPVQKHYVSAYTAAELKTFHCDRVRKMPLSGLDPSMLVGFFCRDEKDWMDFKHRVEALGKNHKSIFSIQDDPPSWPSSDSDSNLGLESISDPEMDLDEPEDDEDAFSFEGDGDVERREGSSRSGSDSPDTSIQGGSGGGSRRGKSSEIDTEEDPIGPITPHAGTFSERGVNLDISKGKEKEIEFDDDDDLGDDDDWVDPVPSSPLVPSKHSSPSAPVPPTNSKPRGKTKERDLGVSKKKKKRSKPGKEVPIIDAPLASQHFPFPSSTNDELSDGDKHGGTNKTSSGKRVPQMRTTKARDGGRTQSGGVRGILVTDDGDDF